MRIFLFCIRCRHKAISKYFQDEINICERSCDFCTMPDTVTKEYEEMKQGVMSTKNAKSYNKSRMVTESSAPDSDLYGGGRKGIKQ